MKKNFLKKLKKFFKKEKTVILAFLFGSLASDKEMKESDIDIAIYFKNYNPSASPLVELKRPKKISDLRRKIWRKLTQILEREVDLICLNEAPASLISAVFKTGIPLKVADKKLYWELYLRKSLEAEDFFEFSESFWKFKKKAKSLTKEAKERLRIRFDFLNDEMKKIERFKSLTWAEYQKSWEERKIVERWTECILNAVIDIAKIILSSEKKEMPKSYGDALFQFGLLIGLSENEADKLAELAELRNILAHEYLEVIFGRIQDFIKIFPPFYKKIFKFVERYLKK